MGHPNLGLQRVAHEIMVLADEEWTCRQERY